MIESKQLVLSPVTEWDQALFLRLFHDPAARRYFPIPCPTGDTELGDYVSQRSRHWQQGFGMFVIYRKDWQGELAEQIGIVGIEQRPLSADSLATMPSSERAMAFYIALDPAYRGQGYGYEAGYACLNHAAQMRWPEQIFAYVSDASPITQAILDKLGMTLSDEALPISSERVWLCSLETFKQLRYVRRKKVADKRGAVKRELKG